jgi:hypothetical protein
MYTNRTREREWYSRMRFPRGRNATDCMVLWSGASLHDRGGNGNQARHSEAAHRSRQAR